MVLTGVLWLEAMHWWELTPTYPGEVNRYWLIFWPTMLLGVLAFGAGAAALVGLVGEDRQQEQRLMTLLAAFSGLLLLLGAFLDGPNVNHDQFAIEVVLAAADLFGVMVGAAIAVLVFALVLGVYESQQPAPHRLAPPTTEQLAQASKVIASNISGGDESE